MNANRFLLACCSILTAVLLARASGAAAQHIGNPGTHVKYNVELEPHFVLQWDHGPNYWYWGGDGIGLGVRASIPVLQDGPVTTINNSLAVSFGLDWAHFGDDTCWGPGPPRNGPAYTCAANDFWLPLVLQWNFFFSDVISAFPEFGLAIEHSRFDGGWWRVNGTDVYRTGTFSRTGAELVLWLGLRVHASKSVAFTLRLGTPSLLLGASFFL